MDGNHRIRGDAAQHQQRAALEPLTTGDTRPHFPDAVRGETCRVCRTEWPCDTVKGRRWWA